MGGAQCIDLAQDMDKWCALVNKVLKIKFHKILGISSVAQELLV
jgi:hypothetical protein